MKKQIFCRVLSLGLAGAMAVGLAACKPQSGESSDYTNYSIPGNTVGEGANGEEAMKLPDYDVQNKTVRLLTHVKPTESSNPGEIGTLEKYYGIKIETEVVAPDQRVSRLQQLVNSGQSPDLFDYYLLPSLITREYVQPMTRFIDLESPLWSGIRESLESLSYQGDIYCVHTTPGRIDGLFYNKEIFENYDLETPTQLLEKGEWNWNTFRDLAMKLTIKGTDGSVSQWGAVIDDYMLINSTGHSFIDVIDGAPVNNLRNESIARAQNFLSNLAAVDNCLYLGANGAELFLQGKLAMIEGCYAYRNDFKDMLGAGTVTMVPPPRDPEADKYYLGETTEGLYIPANCANPVGAAAVIACERYDAIDKARKQKGFEDLQRVCNWTEECQAMVDAMDSDQYSGTSVTWVGFGISKYNGSLFDRVRQGEPWATIAEELYPKIDAEIQRAYNGVQ